MLKLMAANNNRHRMNNNRVDALSSELSCAISDQATSGSDNQNKTRCASSMKPSSVEKQRRLR